MPKFAKAVEAAFGIKTVKTVDTLVATQNKLSTSWELYIKTLSNSTGWLRDFFTFLKNRMEDIRVGGMSPTELVQEWLPQNLDRAKQGIEDLAKSYLDVIHKKQGKMSYAQLDSALKLVSSKIASGIPIGKELKGLEEAQRKLTKMSLDYTTELEKYKKDLATGYEQKLNNETGKLVNETKTRLQKARDEYIKELENFNKRVDEINAHTIESGLKDFNKYQKEDRILKTGGKYNGTDYKGTIKQQAALLSSLKAKYITLRNIVYNVPPPPPIVKPDASLKALRLATGS